MKYRILAIVIGTWLIGHVDIFAVANTLEKSEATPCTQPCLPQSMIEEWSGKIVVLSNASVQDDGIDSFGLRIRTADSANTPTIKNNTITVEQPKEKDYTNVTAVDVGVTTLGKFTGPIIVSDLIHLKDGADFEEKSMQDDLKSDNAISSTLVLSPLRVGVALVNAEQSNSERAAESATKTLDDSVEIQKSIEIYHNTPVQEIHYPPELELQNQPSTENILERQNYRADIRLAVLHPLSEGNVVEGKLGQNVAFIDFQDRRNHFTRDDPKYGSKGLTNSSFVSMYGTIIGLTSDRPLESYNADVLSQQENVPFLLLHAQPPERNPFEGKIRKPNFQPVYPTIQNDPLLLPYPQTHFGRKTPFTHTTYSTERKVPLQVEKIKEISTMIQQPFTVQFRTPLIEKQNRLLNPYIPYGDKTTEKKITRQELQRVILQPYPIHTRFQSYAAKKHLPDQLVKTVKYSRKPYSAELEKNVENVKESHTAKYNVGYQQMLKPREQRFHLPFVSTHENQSDSFLFYDHLRKKPAIYFAENLQTQDINYNNNNHVNVNANYPTIVEQFPNSNSKESAYTGGSRLYRRRARILEKDRTLKNKLLDSTDSRNQATPFVLFETAPQFLKNAPYSEGYPFTGDTGNFRQSKVEYGFKPPMIPSIQYDEKTAAKVDN